MATRELSILVTAKNLAGRTLNQVKGDINDLNSTAKRASSNLGRNVGIGVAAVGAAIAVNVKAGVDSLVELERVEALTAAALKSTGNAADQSVEGIRARSEALETMSGFDDKAIQNAQNLLLTFTGVTEDAFGPATEAIVNMNAALGGDDESLQGLAIKVGKALNDPVKGVTALTRAGVVFTDQQKEQIKTMVEAGDTAGAQGVILAEIQKEFGGAAEAANSGALGAQRKFSDAIEDIQMSLATGFLPLIERVSAKMSELVADPEFLQGVEDFGETLAGGFDKALDFVESVDWGAVGDAFKTIGGGAKMAMDAFLGAPPWLQTAVLTGWGVNKITGGLIGDLAGGLVKGVLGMTAGVVNIKAGAVTGGGGGPIAGGAAGGMRAMITNFAALAAIPLTIVAATMLVDELGNVREQAEDMNDQLDEMPRRNAAELSTSIDKVQGAIDVTNQNIVGGFLGLTRPVLDRLEREKAELIRTRNDLARNIVRGTDQTTRTIDRVNSTMNLERSAANAYRAADAARIASLRDSHRAALGYQARTATASEITSRKSTHFTAITNVSISATQMSMQLSSIRQTVSAGSDDQFVGFV